MTHKQENTMKSLVLVLSLLFGLAAQAGASYKIENWESGEELKLVLRNDAGQFVGHGTLQLESWNDRDETSEWIARRADGTLVAGAYKGKLEKFKVQGLKKEQVRLVIRNAKGHFITWVAMDDKLTTGFEKMDIDRDGKKETVYVVRYQGKFVNWAPAKLESWGNFEHPVLVVRDTADGQNNGKIMTYIAPEVQSNGTVKYRNPKTGRFLSNNR